MKSPDSEVRRRFEAGSAAMLLRWPEAACPVPRDHQAIVLPGGSSLRYFAFPRLQPVIL